MKNKKDRFVELEAASKGLKFNEAKARKELEEKNEMAVKIRPLYLRIFYYSFAITFIIAGIIAVLMFVYAQDSNFFGSADKCYEKALACEEANDTKGAIEELKKCLEITADYSKARLKLIEYYMADGDSEQALALTEEGVERHPRNEKYYELKIKLLTGKNDIASAFAFINSISSNYIMLKLTEVRPDNIVATPDPGTYDSAVTIRFSSSDDSTIHYTTDGSDPTLESPTYSPEQPIVVSKGSLTVRAFAINSEGIVSDEYSTTYKVYNDYAPYTFLDKKVEKIARAILRKSTGTIYYKDLDKITKFSNSVLGAADSGQISDLSDLTEMHYLAEISLSNEKKIKDYSPLLRVPSLTSLTLSGSNIDDSAAKTLFGLKKITTLNLSGNLISDLSEIKNLSALRTLCLSGNALRDSAVDNLVYLSNLRSLDLSNNFISSIGKLSSMTLLTSLNISKNSISDISPISAMSTLTSLDISNNKIKQLDAISRLTNIQTLNVSNNKSVKSLAPIANYTSIINLNIAGTDISSIKEIEALRALATLDCSKTDVQDFSVLQKTKIKTLSASGCGLTSLASLANAPVEVLDVSSNNIADVSPLAHLSNLKMLNISSNPVANIIELKACKNLENVRCSGVTISPEDKKELKNSGINITA